MMNTRTLKLTVLLLLAGTMAGCAPKGMGQSQDRKRWVFVHGAFQGGWTWDRVAKHLREKGEEVTAVTLPAHGDDPTPPKEVTFDDYLKAVSAAVHAGSTPVHLVGHSFGGLVISQYAELEPATVHDLVYVAAGLPQDGETSGDLARLDPDTTVQPLLKPNPEKGTVTLPREHVGPGMCADCDEKSLAEFLSRYQEEPIPPLGARVHLTPANFGSVTKKYVFVTNDKGITLKAQKLMASRVTIAKSATIDSSHQVMTCKPVELAEALLELAK